MRQGTTREDIWIRTADPFLSISIVVLKRLFCYLCFEASLSGWKIPPSTQQLLLIAFVSKFKGRWLKAKTALSFVLVKVIVLPVVRRVALITSSPLLF